MPDQPHPLFTRKFWLACGLLMLMLAKVLAGFWNAWDLKVHDGMGHYASAIQLARTGSIVWNLDSQPLYLAYYSLFPRFFSSPLAIDFMHRVVAIIVIQILLFMLLWRLFQPLVAFLIALWALLLIGHDGFMLHQFILFPLLVMLLSSLSSSPYRNAGILFGAVLAGLSRPEYIFALGIIWVVLVIHDYVTGTIRAMSGGQRQVYIAIMSLGLLVTVGMTWLQLTQSTGRAWDAFSQHYALGLSERYPADWQTRDPWVAFSDTLKATFGDADTITEALRNNPAAFIEHVVWNIRTFPRTLTDILTPITMFGGSDLMLLLFLVGIMLPLYILTIFPLVRLVQRRKRLHDFVPGTRLFWLLLGLTLLPPAVSWFIIYPRPLYMYNSVMILMLILVGIVVQYHFGAWMERWLTPTRLRVFYVLLLLIFPSYLFLNPVPVVRQVVDALPEISGEASYSVVGDSVYMLCLYHDDSRCQALDIGAFPASADPEAFVDEHNIRAVMENERLLENTPPVWQAYWQGLPANPAWQLVLDNQVFKLWFRRQ